MALTLLPKKNKHASLCEFFYIVLLPLSAETTAEEIKFDKLCPLAIYKSLNYLKEKEKKKYVSSRIVNYYTDRLLDSIPSNAIKQHGNAATVGMLYPTELDSYSDLTFNIGELNIILKNQYEDLMNVLKAYSNKFWLTPLAHVYEKWKDAEPPVYGVRALNKSLNEDLKKFKDDDFLLAMMDDDDSIPAPTQQQFNAEAPPVESLTESVEKEL